MILRRLAHNIRQQQWTAIVIEVVILILGVLIAFQVTDWGNQRASRDAERRHLEEIAEDLRADAAVFEQIHMTSERRIGAIDYILGETRGVTRPSSIVAPSGVRFDIPAGPPLLPADLGHVLAYANLLRSSPGSRTGFEALVGAGGMQTIRNRQIGRKMQVYYAALEGQNLQTDLLKQVRDEGIALGYPLGLSAFGQMDPDQLIAIVRGSPAYSAYLRTTREWTAIYLKTVGEQRQLALDLLADIDAYLATGAG